MSSATARNLDTTAKVVTFKGKPAKPGPKEVKRHSRLPKVRRRQRKLVDQFTGKKIERLMRAAMFHPDVEWQIEEACRRFGVSRSWVIAFAVATFFKVNGADDYEEAEA